jgi:hypothetical protein
MLFVQEFQDKTTQNMFITAIALAAGVSIRKVQIIGFTAARRTGADILFLSN